MTKVFAALVLVVSVAPCFGVDHAHKELELNQGKKWATDAPLRQSMGKINQLMRENISDDGYVVLSQKLKQQTDYIFKNCKLSPKADEALHQILIPILKAEQVLGSKAQSQNKLTAAQAVRESLTNYGKYFDHPGWPSN